MRELRDTIWTIVASAHRVAQADAGQPISEQLERVRAAVEGSDIATARREALAAIQTAGSLMDRQRDEQRREFVALADGVRALGTQLEEARRESMIDPLTQLANRKGFEVFLERTIALHTLSGEPASLLMIDMDKFKIANDTFGHDVGDAALRTVGDCLARVFLRRCDLVCRYGGDEFAALLTETPSLKAATLGERVASGRPGGAPAGTRGNAFTEPVGWRRGAHTRRLGQHVAAACRRGPLRCEAERRRKGERGR
jgi:diguanylate cyclase